MPPPLATEWERMLDALPLDERAVNRAFARFREPSLFERPCAREVAALEAKASSLAAADPFAALSKVRRCAALQPEEPGFPLLESRLLLRLDRRVEAAGVLARLGARVAGRPTLESQVALAQAELAWDAGLPQDAGAKLEQVLAWKPGLDLEREAEVKRAALSDPVAGPAIWGFFAADRPESLRLLALSQAVSDRPAEQSVAHYLLGRRLLALDAPAAAAAHLGKALAGSLPEAVLREAWGLRISADYRAGDCNGVQAEIGKMPDFGTAQHATASEWQARCGFEQKAFQGPLVPRDAFR